MGASEELYKVSTSSAAGAGPSGGKITKEPTSWLLGFDLLVV